jgi:hypothetical protein
MMIKFVALWVMKPCSDVVGYRRFGGPYCLYLHPADGGGEVLRNFGVVPHHDTWSPPGRPRLETFDTSMEIPDSFPSSVQ